MGEIMGFCSTANETCSVALLLANASQNQQEELTGTALNDNGRKLVCISCNLRSRQIAWYVEKVDQCFPTLEQRLLNKSQASIDLPLRAGSKQ